MAQDSYQDESIRSHPPLRSHGDYATAEIDDNRRRRVVLTRDLNWFGLPEETSLEGYRTEMNDRGTLSTREEKKASWRSTAVISTYLFIAHGDRTPHRNPKEDVRLRAVQLKKIYEKEFLRLEGAR